MSGDVPGKDNHDWSDDIEGEAAAEEIRMSTRRDFALQVAEEMERQGQNASATTIAQFLEEPAARVLQAFSDLRAAGILID